MAQTRTAVIFSADALDALALARISALREVLPEAVLLVVSTTAHDASASQAALADIPLLCLNSHDVLQTLPRYKDFTRLSAGDTHIKLLRAANSNLLRDCGHILWLEREVLSLDMAAYARVLAAMQQADLICGYLRPFRADSQWGWWQTLALPNASDAERWAAFMPVFGVSRRLIDCLQNAVDTGARGHFEVLLPSLAKVHGFTLVDLAKPPLQLIAKKQFASQHLLDRGAVLEIVLGVPFVHPVKDMAAQASLEKAAAAMQKRLVLGSRWLSAFPRVDSWDDMMASEQDCLLRFPRSSRIEMSSTREWWSGQFDVVASRPGKLVANAVQDRPSPLNDLDSDEAYCLCLHDATVVVPREPVASNRDAAGLPFGKHLLLTSNYELVADSFFRDRALPASVLADSPGHWSIPANDLSTPVVVEEPALFMDLLPSHFGHFLLEGLARLWPLSMEPMAKQTAFRIAAFGMMRFRNPQVPIPQWVSGLLALAGIPLEQMHVFRETTRFRKLIVPKRISPHKTAYGPEMEFLLKAVGERASACHPGLGAGENIYLSRSRLPADQRKLPPDQELQLENLFSDLGYTIVHPQSLPITEQIARVRAASRVAGCAGSQMALLQFCGSPPPPVFLISGHHNPPWLSEIYRYKGATVDMYTVPQSHHDPALPLSLQPWGIASQYFPHLRQSLQYWEATTLQ